MKTPPLEKLGFWAAALLLAWTLWPRQPAPSAVASPRPKAAAVAPTNAATNQGVPQKDTFTIVAPAKVAAPRETVIPKRAVPASVTPEATAVPDDLTSTIEAELNRPRVEDAVLGDAETAGASQAGLIEPPSQAELEALIDTPLETQSDAPTGDWALPDQDTQIDSFRSEPEPEFATPSGDGYVNVDGEQVSSPLYAPSAPDGASAQCADGTYSFSRHRRGTCSRHGGVSTWLP